MFRFTVTCVLVGAAATLAAGPSAGQAPAPPTAQAAGSAELYHVHFVKAAPGKLLEMIDAYVNAPADPEASAPPVILRHREGDDWNLLVVTPLGAEEKLSAAPPPAELQQFLTRTRPLRAQHNDTFATGPVWSEARKQLLGEGGGETAGGTGAVYVVSVFRSLPGHRDQFEGLLRKLAAEEPSSTLTLQHMEGASWEYLMISRYASWTAFGESEQKLRGQTLATSTSVALAEHLAEHHDTVAERVTSPAPPRKP